MENLYFQVDALAQFAETVKSSTKLRISVNVTGSEESRQFQIGENNALIIQTQSVTLRMFICHYTLAQ